MGSVFPHKMTGAPILAEKKRWVRVRTWLRLVGFKLSNCDGDSRVRVAESTEKGVTTGIE
jgi:hypothetical protein